MNSNLALFEEISNPLDSVEDFLSGNDWIFNRPNPDELTVSVTGKAATYRLAFIWQEEFSAMQFFCEYDLRIPKERQELTGKALRAINERIWLGHFDAPEDTGIPCFRHTSLFRGWTHSSNAEHVGDLVEIALSECERHQNMFSMLASSLYLDSDIMSLILSDDAGQA
jgi:hypothetical protein